MRLLAIWIAAVVGALLTAAPAVAEDLATVKGALLMAGGELRFDNTSVWKRFLELAGGSGAEVVVVPAAANEPEKSGQRVVDNLRRYGAHAQMVPIAPLLPRPSYRDAAEDAQYVRILRRARGIWFIGGSQSRITKAFFRADSKHSRTAALQAIWEAYRGGAVIGGSSAGTAIMSRWMFSNPRESLGTLQHGIGPGEVDVGLGFLDNDWFVDQHFLARGRFARALVAMRHLHLRHGIGVDEDSAVVCKDGKFEVVGYRGALVLDLFDAQTDRGSKEFNMRKARLTYLDSGDCMDCRTGAVTVSKVKAADRKLDPRAADFRPYYNQPEQVSDMLANGAIYQAMVHALDSKTGAAEGIAFALDGDKKDLGFRFSVYRSNDSVGWYTGQGGYRSYTLQNLYLDIVPVRMAIPLYRPR
jgi:cyanophycinase